MANKLDFLKTSREQLDEIASIAYNEQIRPVALALWKKHLNIANPQWKYIAAKPFYIKNKVGAAHVMAMVDKRLPDIGIVGYFACTTPEVGAKVLHQAASWLKDKHGLRNVYGPINGTLPNDYRLNLSDNSVFPGEPINPDWYVKAFERAGFEVFNRYVSGLSKHYLTLMGLAIRKPKRDFRHLTVRPFDLKHYSRDFKIYHNLRNAIFPFQSIYCPAISLEERRYNTSGKIDTNFTYFLVDGNREVGFIMAYVYEKKLVIKTIGMLPKYRGKNLRGLLIKPVREQAKKEDLEACIYAMVRVGNRIYANRGLGIKIFRKYVTMRLSM